jgi:hypothetical protein
MQARMRLVYKYRTCTNLTEKPIDRFVFPESQNVAFDWLGDLESF